MNGDQLQAGDVVTLKSGGPHMTIDWIDEIGEVMCSWFDGKNRLQGRFLLVTLTRPGSSLG